MTILKKLSKLKKFFFRTHELFNNITVLNNKIDNTNLKLEEIKWYLSKDNNFFSKKERQVSPKLSNIKQDHIIRYKFASNHIQSEKLILDIACGVGYGTYFLGKNNPNANITGLDIDNNSILYAQRFYSLKNTNYITSDCVNPNLPHNYFDLIISFETLEHLKNYDNFIANINRMLTPKGKLIISSPNESIEFFSIAKYPFHVQHFTEQELTDLLQNTGFAIVQKWSQDGRKPYSILENTRGRFLIILAEKINNGSV